MDTLFFIAAIVVFTILGLFVIPRWRMKRAVRQVIRIFRERNAVDSKNARTIEELGLMPRGMVESLFKGRDYKNYALTFLIQAEVVQQIDDKLYLWEERLSILNLDR